MDLSFVGGDTIQPTKNAIFFFPLQLHLQHMEVPGRELKLELHLQAYASVTATPGLNSIC